MSTTRRQVLRHGQGEAVSEEDLLVTEAPLEIRLGDTPIAVVMRTPGDDADLIRGFALTEAIISGPEDVESLSPVPQAEGDSRWSLVTRHAIDPAQFSRNFYATSSCGVCGKASIDAVRVTGRVPPPGPMLSPSTVAGLPAALQRSQTAFAQTGGLHAAGLFSGDGELLDVREDIGRHNAVDKVIGAAAAGAWPLGEVVLMVSGRVSFEIAQKAAVAGIPIVAAVSAASSLAVELADEMGMTVIGFVREGTFNVYCGPQRV